MEEVSKPSCYSKKAIRGIEIRTKKGGGDRYRVRIRKRGHEEVSRTYRTETLARKNKHRIENELEADRSEFKSPDKHTFNELTIRYMESILPQNLKNARNKRRHLLW